MVAFGHTAVGTIIGVAAYNFINPYTDPIVGLIQTGAVGIIFHYIMDFVPHGHFFRENEYKKKVIYVITLDLFLSVFLVSAVAYFTSEQNLLFLLYILFGIGGSQLPDILDGLIYTGILPSRGMLKIEQDFHNATHWHGKKEKALLWSNWDIWQISVFISALGLLFYIQQ